jgi:hypothetical protein
MTRPKNKSGFKTPETYFETFEERLFQRIASEKFPKATGFTVPPRYFENLEDRVLEHVGPFSNKKKIISLFPEKYWGYAAIAASLVLAFIIFEQGDPISEHETIPSVAIDRYIEEGNLNMDLYELTSFMDDSNLNNLNIKDQQIATENLKNYLLETIDEETLIFEQ